jgi:hypothetical protein
LVQKSTYPCLAEPHVLLYNSSIPATVAQPAEQPLRKRRVKGSIPFGGSQAAFFMMLLFLFFSDGLLIIAVDIDPAPNGFLIRNYIKNGCGFISAASPLKKPTSLLFLR